MSSALWIGATGLMASSKQLDVIGNNLANTNTVGYKGGNTLFSAMLSQNLYSGSGNMQVGQGVITSAIPTQFTQGTMETTGNVLDLAIDGNGFFIVKDNSGAEYYTRAGSFHVDKNGNLVDVNGYFVQGYNLYSTTPSVETTINLQNIQSAPKATTEIKASANLTAQYDPANPAVFNISQNIYDTKGGIHSLNLQFTQTGPNTWNCEAYIDGTLGPVSPGTIPVVFNPDGTLFSPAGPITINLSTLGAFSNGATLEDVSWDIN
ncbi:MAG: flagellar hook-basal body complex protein, partial [Syntrophobacterales bacterium]|nr:flagellar hook-basal body complex protein [Syntrophobacterales bacterium]